MKKLIVILSLTMTVLFALPALGQQFLSGPPNNCGDLFFYKDGSKAMTANLRLFVVPEAGDAPVPQVEGELIFAQENQSVFFSYTNDQEALAWMQVASIDDVGLKVSKTGDTMTGALAITDTPMLTLASDVRLNRTDTTTLAIQTLVGGETPTWTTRAIIDETGISSGLPTITASMLQAAAADLGAADVGIDLSNSQENWYTNLTIDGSLYAGWLFGDLEGDVTGDLTGNADTVTNGVYTTDTGTVTAKMLQAAAADLGAADVTINLGNTNGSYNTNMTIDGTVTAGGFSGPLTGAVTGTASGNPAISSGTAAPETTPGKVGDIYVDTTAHKLYFADGTSSSSNWVIAN